MAFWDSHTFTFVVLPIFIFLSRIVDVTIGTVRIILVGRGHKYIAPVLGFFEVLIWVIVIGKVMQNLNNVFCYIAYAGGFATGNFVGICLEERLAVGNSLVRIITKNNAGPLVDAMNESNYGATSITAHGKQGQVYLVYAIIRRSDFNHVNEIIKGFDPKAFYSIEDVRFVSEGIFPVKGSSFMKNILAIPRWRKGK